MSIQEAVKGDSAMKVNVVARVTIDALPAAVFSYIADLRYHPIWNPPLVSVSPLTKLKKGMRYTSTTILLGVKVQHQNQVTKFVSGKEVEICNKTGLLQYRVLYQLRAKGKKQTVLITHTTVSSDSRAFAVTTPVLKVLAHRELYTDLRALKALVEQPPETLPAA
jgi:hypothetical protein